MQRRYPIVPQVQRSDIPRLVRNRNDQQKYVTCFGHLRLVTNDRAVVDIECSTNAVCPDIVFKSFNITPPTGSQPRYICKNVENEFGLPCE